MFPAASTRVQRTDRLGSARRVRTPNLQARYVLFSRQGPLPQSANVLLQNRVSERTPRRFLIGIENKGIQHGPRHVIYHDVRFGSVALEKVLELEPRRRGLRVIDSHR